METAFVIHIVQLGQYGTTSVNMDFFFSCLPILFRAILILSRFYIRINDKIETLLDWLINNHVIIA
jgi:hypothetical protein